MRAESLAWPCALLLALHCAWAGGPSTQTPGPLMSPSRVLVKLWEQPGAFREVKLVEFLGDTLYLAGTPRHLEARDPADGALRWRHIGKLPVDYPPVERNQTLYLIEGGYFVTLDRATGDELSRHRRTRLAAITPIYAGQNAWLIGASDNRLYVLAPNAAYTMWRTNLDDHILWSAWDGEDMAYFLTAAGSLYAASISTRRVAWQYTFDKPGCSRPTLVGDTLYVGNEDYRLYALDAASGTLKWKALLSGPARGVPVVARGRVYAADSRGVLNAVDLETHQVLWTLEGAERVLTTTEEHVIVLGRAGEDRQIVVADAGDGQVKARVSDGRYRFFVARPEGGIFYAIASNGDILAVADRKVAEARLGQEQ